jgi:hypothetical protein
MKRISVLVVLSALVAAAVGCGDEVERDPKLNIQVIGWGSGQDGTVGFQPRLPVFDTATQVRVNLTHPGTGQLVNTAAFNPSEQRAVIPKLRFGNDLRMEFEVVDTQGVPVATGATPLFDFDGDELVKGYRIQVDEVDTFSPVGSVVNKGGRSELTQSRMDYRAVRDFEADRWLGRVGHVTVPYDGGNKALIVGGAHVDPVRRPAGLPQIKIVQDDLMEFDPATGYFTDLSYDPQTRGVRANSADRLFEGRAFHTVTPVGDDKFLVIGGFTSGDPNARALNSIEFIDLNAAPGTRVQQLVDASGSPLTLEAPRAFHTATYRPSDNTVIVAGGVGRGGENDVLDSVEIIDLDESSVQTVGQMSEGRAEHEAVLMGDGETVWLLGGRGPGGALSSTETVSGDAGAVSISAAASMNTARYAFAALRIAPNNGSLVMAIGGYTDLDGNVTDTFEFSSLGRDEFLAEGNWRLEEGRGNPQAIELSNSNNIVVLGGRDGSQARLTSSEVLEFGDLGDPKPYTARTTAGTSHNERADFTATPLSNGKILLIGGVGRFDGTTTTLDSAEYFTPLDPRGTAPAN